MSKNTPNTKEHTCTSCGLSKKRGYYKTEDGRYFFTFNWTGGGFNQVYAKTRAAAIREGNKTSNIFTVDESTINKCTPTERDAWYKWVK